MKFGLWKETNSNVHQPGKIKNTGDGGQSWGNTAFKHKQRKRFNIVSTTSKNRGIGTRDKKFKGTYRIENKFKN